jgi:hypothetical protein
MKTITTLILAIAFCSTKLQASNHNLFIFKNSMVALTSRDGNDIMDSVINEREKIDTIFHIKKRGKDEKIIKYCGGSDVLIVIDANCKILSNRNFNMVSALIRKEDSLNEMLYKHKNYIGFNPYVLANNCVGFNYMRDLRKLHLVVNAPITVGFDVPKVTNYLQGLFHYEDQGTLTFNKLNYQLGVSLLFVPIMNRSANFLIGPSYLFTSYNVTTTLYYNIPYNNTHIFKNDFELRRHYYGISIGFLKRFHNRFNLTMLLTLGSKTDSYSKSDPFGTEYVKSIGGNYYSGPQNFFSTKSDLYSNFMWTFGYRF